ncbi:N-carbamoylputrescine amidase [Vigna angularis]|uniref:N-carbamoylputrescine amidase n=3 Tax=Phaseolus angularis TaxID=3914 RepID=A0A8T0JH13_PHAAN|nr:N-carbamoylputrescine amidase [Vigna angularis]
MEKRRTVVVSALQFACTDDVSTNVATAERLVRAAHKQGANIILIQELFEGYYFCQAQREDYIQRAKPHKDHPTILRMQKLAKELGVVIPVSFFEEANNAHYNSIAIIDADGTDLGIYRKSHIPDGPGYEEKFYFNPGDTGFKVFQTKFAKIGVAICWDQWFPEAARAMVLQGAEILFYPTAIGTEPHDANIDSRDHWKRVMQGHAGANLVPLVASNRIGKEIIETEHGKSEITFYGNSFIAGPTGEIVSIADDKEEAVLIAQFDLDKIKSTRHSWGVFRDRRPDLYKVLLTLDGTNPVRAFITTHQEGKNK